MDPDSVSRLRAARPAGRIVRSALAISLFLALLLLLAPRANAGSVPASLVVNGSFESPSTGFSITFFAPDSFEGWTVDQGSVDILGSSFSPADGTQSLDLSGDDAGSIYQDLATTPGGRYTLTFSFAGNPTIAPDPGCFAQDRVKQMEVFWGGSNLGTFSFDTTGRSSSDVGWQLAQITPVADQAVTRLRFTSLNPGRCGIALDNVVVLTSNSPPDCSGVSATPSLLWPPNHKLRLANLGGVTDPDGDPVTITITGVTQDEPLNGLGDGDTSPDATSGAALNEVYVRAERSGLGDGRVYRVSFTGSDGKGGTCSGTVTVGVPRNMGPTPIDSGQTVNSFGT